ncbi:MAG: S-layer homology domain-containing protein [Bacillota bacterium]
MRETSNLFSKQNSQQPKQFRGDDKKVMKKSLLAFVLAFSLVLSVAVPAFAATPADVVGKKEQSVVEELTALGVLNGYADGTFKPENPITRAELAKVIIIASGNEAAAKWMQTIKPEFKDVKTNVWYSGYINAAKAQGFVQGYNGNYRPTASVKFEEVVTILVRALGYKEAKLTGSYPFNYVLKAQEIGLFNGIDDINVGSIANRGTVATLTSNALNAKLVSYNGTTGEEILSAKSLVSKLGDTTTAEVLSDAVVDGKITLRTGGVSAAATVADNFVVTGGKSLVDLLGHNVTVVKKGGKVVAITSAQDSAATLTGTFVSEAAGSVTIKVGSDNKTKSTVANTVYFVNGEVKSSLEGTSDVTLYLTDDKVRVAVATKWAAKDALVTSFEAKTDYRDARLNTSKGSTFITAATLVTLDGKTVSAADLKADDVVSFVKKDSGVATKVVATRKVATGKLESVSTSGSTTKYTVAGTQYEGATGADVALLTAANIGKEYTLILNADGKIVKAVAPTAASNNSDAIILEVKTVQAFEDEALVNKQKVTYFSIKDNANVTKYAAAAGGTIPNFATSLNHLVELKFDGEKLVGIVTDKGVANTTADTKVTNVTATRIDAGASYLIASKTVVVKATSIEKEKLEDKKLSLGAVTDITKEDYVVAYSKDGVTADYIILTVDNEAVSSNLEAVSGLLVSATKTATSATANTYTVIMNVYGASKTIEVDGAAYEDLNGAVKNDFVTLSDAGSASTKFDAATVTKVGNVTTINETSATAGSTFTINAANTPFIVSGKTTVYVVAKDGSVYVGSYTDVKDLDVNNAGVTTISSLTTVDKVVVVDADTNLGSYNEALAVVIYKK